MPQLRIRKVAVLGAGVMGAQIAAHTGAGQDDVLQATAARLPRGALALMLTGRAYAVIAGRDYVVPGDPEFALGLHLCR